jgi:type I restriction enzyme S subunit
LRADRSTIDPAFLNYWLNSSAGQAQIKPLATRGVSQANINPTQFKKRVRVPCPPLEEQHHIAGILSTWEQALDRLERQIARKHDRFASLRALLIHGGLRLNRRNEPWPKQALRSFLEPTKRPVPKPAESYVALSIRSHGKGTFQRVVDRPESVDMEVLFRISSRDLIVNITFAWEGAIALAKPEDEGCLVSHRFPTFEIDETTVDRDFLGYAVNDERFFHYLGIVSPRGAGRNRVLNQGDFLDLEIPFPPLPEQRAISTILNDARRELAALEAELAALAKQSDALTTELLTGCRRVPMRGYGP